MSEKNLVIVIAGVRWGCVGLKSGCIYGGTEARPDALCLSVLGGGASCELGG